MSPLFLIKPSCLRHWVALTLVAAVTLCQSPFGYASDHADPLDIPLPWQFLDNGQLTETQVKELGGGLTDLFIFPVKENGEVAFFPPRDEYFRTDIPTAQLDQMIPEERALGSQLTSEEYAKYHALNRPDQAAERADVLIKARQARFKLQELSAEQLQQIHSVVVILCLNRDVIKPPPYNLAPYTYTICMDRHSTVSYDRPEDQANRARYGGTVTDPKNLKADIWITMNFANDGTMSDVKYTGFAAPVPEGIRLFPEKGHSALRDDPFIFSRFFKKNVIAAVFQIPLSAFSPAATPDQWILWATSQKGSHQIDHDGRSLRTQQPRFNLLNTVHPKDQVDVLKNASVKPDLYPDIFLRAGFDFVYEYRPWDFVPDVVIYNERYRTRFPNGRLLTDDVANLLARNGDGLLMELSYKNATWPRATANDKPFLPNFPYLAEPWAWSDVTPPPPGHPVRPLHKLILVGGGVVFAIILLFLGWLLGHFNAKRHRRDQYL